MKNPRSLVSKKKRRFIDKERKFDLDLTYIGGQESGRIIAMGFPSEGVSTLWRNPLPEVRRFLETYHGNDKVAVYNLCSETQYHQSLRRFERCHQFGFEDRNPCPLAMIRPFCLSVEDWLGQDSSHVAAIHCRAGKGRTGMMVSCFLVHSGRCESAEEALKLFGTERTSDGNGVTIPSQKRYVDYYKRCHSDGILARPRTFQIERVRLVGVPNVSPGVVGGGCDPFFRVVSYWMEEKIMKVSREITYDSRKQAMEVQHYTEDDKVVDLECGLHNVTVKGDVKLILYHYDRLRRRKKEMCHIWFHTGFVDSGSLSFTKSEIDRAVKDKKSKIFPSSFKIEISLKETEK